MKHQTDRASLGWLNTVAKGKRRLIALLILLPSFKYDTGFLTLIFSYILQHDNDYLFHNLLG